MLYRLMSLVLAVFLCAPLQPAAASGPTFSIWQSSGNGPYRELAEQLEASIRAMKPGATMPARVVREDKGWPALPADPDTLIVAVGTAAATHLAQAAPHRPVLNVLIPSGAYQALEADRPADSPGPHSAIFLDQPLWRQLALIQYSLPGTETVGILLGPMSRALRTDIETAAADYGLVVKTALINPGAGHLASLSRLLERSDVLWAIPDQEVFNRQTLQGILLSSYRREIPMFGFSAGYVRAGALAAVYSTPTQIADQAAEWVARWLEDPRRGLPPPAYPAYYGVAVNQQVARSLNIRMPGGSELQRELKEAEDSQP